MMRRRTLAITVLGLLVTLFLLADSSFAYVRYYRLQRELYRPPRNEQVEQFIAGLKAGNTQQFRYVEYDLLRGVENQFTGVMDTIVALAREELGTSQFSNVVDGSVFWIYWLTDHNNANVRAKVVQAALAGLKNLDPSVRLTAVYLLRRLIPDVTMQMSVKQALARETVAAQWEYWRERNVDVPSSENPWLEGQFWDEDEQYSYTYSAPWLRYRYEDRIGADDSLWGYQEGAAQVTDGFNGSWTHEDTSHVSSGSVSIEVDRNGNRVQRNYNNSANNVTLGQANWADNAAGGWEGATVPVGGSWYRPNDDIRPYVGDYQLQYLYVRYLGNQFVELYGNPWAETYKLDLFITRSIWWDKIRRGQMNCMVIISKDTFKSLYMSIDGESPENIPFPSTATTTPMLTGSDIDVIIQGLLRNTVVTNRWIMARALKYIYQMTSTTDAQKVKIIRAIRRAKYQENRIDIYRGDELYNELVGETTSGVQRRGSGLSFPLGFNPSNDETINPSTPINIVNNIYFDNNNTPDNTHDDAYVIATPVSNNANWAQGGPIVVRDEMGNVRAVNNASGQPIANGWVINAEEIERAQEVIDALRLGTSGVFDTVLFEDVRNAVLITLYRVRTQTGHANVRDPLNTTLTGADAPWLQFFSALQSAPIRGRDLGQGSGLTIAKRTSIIAASLTGLINPDPRVRLSCMHWLRRCNPDTSMLEAVQGAWDIESVLYVPSEADPQGIDRGDHEFIDAEGFVLSKEANEELRKLYRFIVRRELVELISSGAARNVLSEIPRSRFMTLTTPIDNEDLTMIPLYNVDPNINPNSEALIKPGMLSTIAYGIRNPNFLNQKETAIYLIRYYNAYVVYDQDNWRVDESASLLGPAARNQIINTIMEAKDSDIVIFEHEALLTGELEVQGRAVVEMYNPDTNEPNPLAMAITYKNQWNNAVAIRESMGITLQY